MPLSAILTAGVVGVVFLATVGLTEAVRRCALRRRMVDAPDERRAHTGTVPRGGGLGIVLTVLPAAALLFALQEQPDWRYFYALAGGGAAVAAVGFLDDIRSVPPLIRLAVHFAAAVWALSWLNQLPDPSWFLGLPVAQITYLGSVILFVWMINLYNFMDGIDGLAATETIFLAVAGGVMLHIGGGETLARLSWALAAGAAGFLVWNRPPARIFLGDVGSGFLGFTVAALMFISHDYAILQWQANPVWDALRSPHIWPWLILVGILFTDASVTLLRRILRREAFWRPHSMHAYQHAARRHGHGRVVLGMLAVNVVLPLPAAIAAWLHIDLRIQLTVAVWAVLSLLALALGAGRPRESFASAGHPEDGVPLAPSASSDEAASGEDG